MATPMDALIFTGPYATLLSIWIDVPAAIAPPAVGFPHQCVGYGKSIPLAFGITWGLRDPCALAWLTTKW
jgi:hypothetical protein